MTITYKTNSIGIKCPVLHKVVYSKSPDGIQSQYYHTYKDCLVDEWLKKNCRHTYYHGPGYLPEKSIQFECDEDAMWFALRWL